MEQEQVLIHQFITQALKEDVGNGDHTSLATIPQGQTGKAKLLIKESGVLAGIDIAKQIFKEVDSSLIVDVFIEDGTEVNYGDIAFYVKGSVHAILIAERLVLNTMQRMSGIATTTRRMVTLLKDTHTKVLDTRKTTPNLRFLEKAAVKIGGGENHRFGLYDMILIKDNHVDYAGGITEALASTKAYLAGNNLQIPVEIEVRNLQELREAMASTGIDRILLDNFNYKDLRDAVQLISGKFVTEASGGITEENIIEYANCGVDYVSMGALTHSVKSLDMSLKAFRE